jgi:FtsP/CotA-like multicopper oxidase with cupredoxin domain
MIDNHNLTVIAMDLVPIVPYTTSVLSIAIGQRYDVIVDMTEATADYWIRAIPQITCSDNDNADNIRGILRYDSTSTSDPTTSAYTYTDNCDDEDMSNLVPYLAMDASSANQEDDFAITFGITNNVFKWYMAATTFTVEMDNPTLLQVYEGDTNFTTSAHVIELDTANEWVYFIIEQSAIPVPHPIHLHGHDFYILAQGSGTYDSANVTLELTNPPRRDVAMLPGDGYLVIAFLTDNPGAWLMHCHIAWHTGSGFALQLVERISEIPALIDYDTLNATCAAWDTYTTANNFVQDVQSDSGV